MNVKNNICFALQKLSMIALCFALAVFSFSCLKSENDPSKLIIGKWERIADASNESFIHNRTDGLYWEFFSDGTAQYFLPGATMSDGIWHFDGIFKPIGPYEIDKDFLITKTYYDNGGYSESRYKYKFSGDQLKLTREPLIQRNDEFEDIYFANYFYFKRIN